MCKIILSILAISFVFAQVASEKCDVVGELKADKKDCGKFYQCTNLGWIEFVCQSGLYFNPVSSACDWPCNVICNPDKDDQPILEPCSTIGQMKGEVKDCQQYYVCTADGWESRQCKAPLLFNSISKTCDYALYVTCAK
ncbi:hypothetical protein WA026_018659 [Henosepilachna vigintioctopunctata]|uniref:Chitin-binding type-2 domain-containing protein n=1 Tax=Henosepilachna vigintioctopunctata TaxID=420089 RepID=A0AAW1U4Q1_9CUCU